MENDGTKDDDESEIFSVGGPLTVVGGCNPEAVIFEEETGRADLISETETALDSTGLPFCWFSNFSTTINILSGFYTCQLIHPLSQFSFAHKSAENEDDFAIRLCFSLRFCRRTCQTTSSWQWMRAVCFRQRV